jgi:hypothetical protein
VAVEWVKGYIPELLIQRFEEAKTVDSNGKASFQGLDFSYNIVVLNSMVSFSSDIPELEKRRITNQAVFNVAGIDEITPRKLLSEMNNLEKQYLINKPIKYVLITSVSIKPSVKLKRQLINGCAITFHQTINKNFFKEIDQIRRHASYSIHGEFPRDYLYVKISVKGKSYSEAADKAIDSIDLWRGIWNLYHNRRHPLRISSGARQQVNEIVLGPLHTLHFPDGKLATESWWYEPEYRGPLNTFDPKSEIGELYKFQSNVRKSLKKNPFKPFLFSAIMRYARALDLTDWENAFLRLWGILETLTNTGENDSHKVTVKRTSFFYKDRKYTEQILTHLRSYRNMAVHAGTGNQDIEAYMYQLKNYVETAMQFLIVNKFGLNNLDELAQLLDLPNDRRILAKRIKLINSALKYTKN